MTSESSSAVLSLQDADEAVGDGQSERGPDEDGEPAPLIMEHGYDIAVKVDAPMKQLSTLETFVTYRVRCVCARWARSAPVRRRYNHFKSLHHRLSAAHPLLAVPPLPPLHSPRQQLARYSATFVTIRTLALHCFLDRIAKHPILTHSEDFRLFLTTPDDQFEKVFKSENSAMNLWGFGSSFYTATEPSKTDGPRVKDPEFTAIADYLQSVQQKLHNLCTLVTKLCKGSAQLGIEWERMKRVSDAWSSQTSGPIALATGGVSRGAGGAATSRRAGGAARAKALLPLLATYAGVMADKIRQRDGLHVAHVAGNNSDELHNRLEQASESLRADLSDWTPKTRGDVKGLLLELANRQVSIHSQTLQAWEHALKLSSSSSPEDIFKTVSKTAVLNLSPSKCRSQLTPTETERDIDDLDNYSNDSDGIQDIAVDLETYQTDKREVVNGYAVKELTDEKIESTYSKFESLDSRVESLSPKTESSECRNSLSETPDVIAKPIIMTDPLQDILQGLNEEKLESVDPKIESLSSKSESLESKNSEPDILSKPVRMTDPLQDFSDVDLS